MKKYIVFFVSTLLSSIIVFGQVNEEISDKDYLKDLKKARRQLKKQQGFEFSSDLSTNIKSKLPQANNTKSSEDSIVIHFDKYEEALLWYMNEVPSRKAEGVIIGTAKNEFSTFLEDTLYVYQAFNLETRVTESFAISLEYLVNGDFLNENGFLRKGLKVSGEKPHHSLLPRFISNSSGIFPANGWSMEEVSEIYFVTEIIPIPDSELRAAEAGRLYPRPENTEFGKSKVPPVDNFKADREDVSKEIPTYYTGSISEQLYYVRKRQIERQRQINRSD